MSRFSQAASYTLPSTTINAQYPVIGNTTGDTMTSVGQTLPSYAASPYGGSWQGDPTGLPPDPYGYQVPDPYSMSYPSQHNDYYAGQGMPIQGSLSDPYSMSGVASPPPLDPYAPGGVLSSGAATPTAPNMLSAKNLASRFGRHNALPPPGMPKWIKWLCIVGMIGVAVAILVRLLKREPSSARVPEVLPHPPPSSAPPVCKEEVVLRISKDDPVVVKIENTEPLRDKREEQEKEERRIDREERRRDREERRRDKEMEDRRIDKENEDKRKYQKNEPERLESSSQVPPVVIVNEAPPRPDQDLWELSYANNSGAALPRMSDTNMVYTQVGGAFR